MVIYKGYEICYNIYGTNEYSVQYCGDDVIFESANEAIEFIDEIAEE